MAQSFGFSPGDGIDPTRSRKLVGTSEQSLRLWEKQRKKALPNSGGVPGSADRLLRAIYSEYIGGDGTVRRITLNKMTDKETAQTKAQRHSLGRRQGRA